MDKIKIVIIIFALVVSLLLLWTIASFVFFYDDSENLGGGYTYYPEQKDIIGKQDILPYILEYKYNSDIIVVKQHPAELKDVMYTDYDYPLGRDTIYYWIIDKDKQMLHGPLDYNTYVKEVKKYDKVPEITENGSE